MCMLACVCVCMQAINLTFSVVVGVPQLVSFRVSLQCL